MVSSHHEISRGKHLVRPLLRQPDTNERCAVRVHRVWIKGVTAAFLLIIISNSNNSVLLHVVVQNY